MRRTRYTGVSIARKRIRGNDRKLVGENEAKLKFEPQARSLSEIGKAEAQPKAELNEDSFLI